ncbi:hypothetical protein CLOM_g16450 [Closterium sp. NIES-68]|nr:hypothetical protein CLOM_g16450 [Closterium sp. NIES-68]GJP71346.1 hypothetical protein CLOP_g2186 [Closterium sp. NIES-67]
MRICLKKGPIPMTYGEHSRSPHRPQEDRSSMHVEDTREREGMAAIPRCHQLLQQVRATIHKNCRTTHESAKKKHALRMGIKTAGSRGAVEMGTHVRTNTYCILPDPERDYAIEADASDQAVGGEWTETNRLP